MNPSDHLSDAISAGSLVLGVLAALYTLWLADSDAALAIKPKADKDDRGP
jgi:divalent metal cation (Fe/Co/Zn/Cd) transporter